MATELLSLFARIGIDDKEYNKGIEGAESKAKKFGKGVKTAFKVGTAAIGATVTAIAGVSTALYKGAKETAAYGDQVDKMSQKIGISAKAYQEWNYVMQRADINVDSLKMGLKTLSTQAEKNSDAFQALGISEEEVANLSKEDLFNKVVNGLAEMEDGTERTVLATKLLGRAGADMAPLLNQGTEAIAQQKQMAEDYGMVMSDEAVKASAAFQDSLTTLSMTTTGLKNRLMGEFLPSITSVTDGLALMFTSSGQEEGLQKFNEGIQSTIGNVASMIPKLLDIGVPIIENIVTSIVSNLPSIATAAVKLIVDLVGYIISALPQVLQAAVQIVLALVTGISSNAGMLLNSIAEVIAQLVTMITDPSMLTNILSAALQLVTSLAMGIVEAIPVLLEAIPVLIENLITFILQGIPMVINTGVQLLMSLVGALPSIINGIVSTIPLIIQGIIDAVTENLPLVIEAGINLFLALIDALPTIVMTLVSSIPQIVNSLLGAFKGYFPKMKKMGQDILNMLLKGIVSYISHIGRTIKKVYNKIKSELKETIDKAKDWGKDMLQNFISGIEEKVEDLKKSITKIIDWIKDHLGFSVPKYGALSDADTWMPDFMDLLAEGVNNNSYKVENAIDSLAGNMSLGSYDDGYYEPYNDTQTFEFTFAEGNAPLLQIARLIFPYMKVVAKEKGGAF